MSDEINTQHGTIGLLMAECEQLRRDLAQAKAELAKAKNGFTKYQRLYEHVRDENARLESDNAQLREKLNLWILGDNSALEDLLAPTIRELEQCVRVLGPSAFESTKAELSRLRSILTSSEKSDTNTP